MSTQTEMSADQFFMIACPLEAFGWRADDFLEQCMAQMLRTGTDTAALTLPSGRVVVLLPLAQPALTQH